MRTYGSECGNAKKRFVLPAQHQKVRRVFCGLFNIRLSTPPIGREAALLWRVERVRFCKRCLGGNLSPLISRCRDKLLAVFFPPEGKLSRKRLMRGDQSALTKGIHSPCASRPPIGREAAPCKNPLPLQTTKTSPQEHPPHTKRNKTSHCIGGCSWGEVPGGEGGLEGEEAPFQGGSFSLQGLSLTPTQKRRCRVGSIDPFRQSACRDCRAQ